MDRGVVNTLTLSTGERLHIPEPDWAKRAKLQRRLARQQKGSNRRAETKRRLARLAAREADRRKDFVEKTTTDLARRFDLVRVEDLKVPQMVRSAKGTIENPGTRVAQKRGLNRGIASQSWGLFEQRLRHKIGDRLETVPAAYTSQTCSCCGHTASESRKNQALFVCVACGHSEHADVNAAINIARGQRVPGSPGRGRGGTGAIRPPDETSTNPSTEAA